MNRKVSLHWITKGWLVALLVLTNLSCSTTPLKSTQQPARKLDAGMQTVFTLDVYQDQQRIHTLLSGEDKQTGDTVLRYLYSDDTGESWSFPQTLDFGPLKNTKRGDDFQIAAINDRIMAVWKQPGAEPWVGVIAIAFSQDGGQSWQRIPSPVGEQYATVDQGYFDITADSQGRFHLVWLDDREEAGNTQSLRYARFNGNADAPAWAHERVLEATVCTCCWSKVSADQQGHIHVLFRDDSPRDMTLISSLNHGEQWLSPRRVAEFNWEFIGCPHQGGGLTVQQGGNTVLHTIVWNGQEGQRGLYYSARSDESDDGWLVAVPLSDDSAKSGDIAVSENRIGVVYTAGLADRRSIMVKFSENGGNSWSAEKHLPAPGGDGGSHPRIIAVDQGFRVFWTEWQSDGNANVMMSALL